MQFRLHTRQSRPLTIHRISIRTIGETSRRSECVCVCKSCSPCDFWCGCASKGQHLDQPSRLACRFVRTQGSRVLFQLGSDRVVRCGNHFVTLQSRIWRMFDPRRCCLGCGEILRWLCEFGLGGRSLYRSSECFDAVQRLRMYDWSGSGMVWYKQRV